jgi:hypothetical protein
VETRFRCPCCGCKTLDAPEALGLCPVCWWEDDGQEDKDASDVRLTVNGALSLAEARAHFAARPGSESGMHPRTGAGHSRRRGFQGLPQRGRGNYRKYAKIPGFRAGKVPETVIKRRFADARFART